MKDMILVFTGNGKGKTTAALGQAMRALGQGKKVAVVQFLKGPWLSGEDNFASTFHLPSSIFQISKTGKGFVGILGDKLPLSEHKKAAKEGLELAKKIIKQNKCDLLILDEINNAVDLKLLAAKDVLDIIRMFPKDKDLVLTGRGAKKSVIAKADIVTEMREVKHHFSKGAKVKKGIDY